MWVNVHVFSEETPEMIVTDLPTSKSHDQSWRFKCLSDLSEIHLHAVHWRRLEKKCDNAYAAFQSYSWCESWVRTFCPSDSNCSPRVWLISRGTKLVAILPLMKVTQNGLVTIALLGEPHSQISNILSLPDEDCVEGIRLCLAQCGRSDNADIIALGPIPDNSRLAKALDPKTVSKDPADYLSILTWEDSANGDDYMKGLSRNRRKDIGKKERRLEDMGDVSFTQHRASEENLSPLIDLALRWKHEWLARTGTISNGLSRDHVDRFLAQIDSSAEGFDLEMEALRLNGDAIALTINLVGKGVRHCYLTSYDNDLAVVSPGTLIHQRAILASLGEGKTAYNLLGFPSQFKAKWTNHTIDLIRCQIGLTLKGRLWISIWTNRLRPLAKRALIQLRDFTSIPVLGNVLSIIMGRVFKTPQRK